ncbi:MAG: multi-sensor hybrid histidine kinase [bacterium]|nr:MAG: multi-sensor hybrid histidine kinase [bacterium]
MIFWISLKLNLEEVHIEVLVQSALRMIKQTAHKKQIQVEANFDESISRIYADERRFKQILVNLLSNAVKFTPEGGKVGIDVFNDPENNLVTFIVWDSGIGISENDLSKLFKPFVQINSTLSRQYSGTGLGLTMVQKLVELHGGGIKVESTVGKGSSFAIALPNEANKTAGLISHQLVNFIEASKLRLIFIIADHHITTTLIVHYLNCINVQSVIYSNRENILLEIYRAKPNIIIVDADFINLSDSEILKKLKENTLEIPVLVISSNSEELRDIADDRIKFLAKPITCYKLYQLLNSLQLKHKSLEFQAPSLITNNLGRVLVVDDDPASTNLFYEYLTAKGYTITIANDGVEGLEKIQTEKPELILLDIHLPIMDGLEIIKLVRSKTDPTISNIPIIVVTALALPENRRQCLAAGANDYIFKPVNLKLLCRMIETQLIEREQNGLNTNS